MYEIIYTPKFEKDFEFYYKKRKYKHIADDIKDIISNLEKGNLVGDELEDIASKIPSTNKTFKVRAANSDMKVGKSKGYRLIYYAISDDNQIYLLTIYAKKDNNNIASDNDIVQIIKEYCI